MSELCILRVDASMNRRNSTSRMLTDALVKHLCEGREARVIVRDLAEGVPFIDEAWIDANFTDPADRSDEQNRALAESDKLVDELKQADVLVMGVPIYNFGVPAAFKAWIDQIARARETFQYSPKGPVGLLEIRKGYLLISSGGTPVGGDMDFATRYTKLLLGFLGVTDLEIIPCDGVMTEGEDGVERTLSRINTL